MEFKSGFHGQFQSPHIPTLFAENPIVPQPNNPLFQPNITSDVTNMTNHFESFPFVPVSASTLELMDGGVPSLSRSITINHFNALSTPCLGQNCFIHQLIPSNEQFIKDFIDPANVNFAQKILNSSSYEPQNNIYNTDNAKFTVVSSSHPPTPPPLVSGGGHGSTLKLRKMENLANHIKKSNQQANGSGMIRRQSKKAKTQNYDNRSDSIIKSQWTPDEDRVLKEFVDKHGEKKWSKIAMLLENRIGKQCRERWYNHLQPNIKKGPWTVEEDIMLIQAHKELGNKWTKIAKKIPGRSQNTIKNHWHVTKRSKNLKGHNEHDDSVLRAYIKDVIVAPTNQKEEKNNNKEEEEK